MCKHRLLVILCVGLAAPRVVAQVPAKVHAAPEFVAWLGDAVLLEERWVEVPEAGLGVAYGLRSAAPGAKGGLALEDAFLLFDLKTHAPVGKPLVRTTTPRDGCPAPGNVLELTVRSDGKGPALSYGGSCLVRVERRGPRLFPDPNLPLEASFPEAVQAVRSSERFKAAPPAGLTWVGFPQFEWLFARSSTGCSVWYVDRITHRLDEARALDLAQAIASCLGGPCEEASTDADPTRPLSVWTGGQTRSCECALDTRLCHSPAQLAEMEAEGAAAEREAEAREPPHPEELDRESLKELLKASREANLLWRYKKRDDALQVWRALYRKYVEAGRTVAPDAFDEPWQEIRSLLGTGGELKYARVDTWAEVLNNLGFALWSAREYRQAAVVYAECAELLKAHGRTRPVLELNWGDLERDRGRKAEARMHYERYLESKPSESQRRRIAQELQRLQ